MVKYRYVTEVDGINLLFPGQSLNIEISNPQKEGVKSVKCLLDTGSDLTTIPDYVISSLRLNSISTTSVEDYEGNVNEEKEIYLAKLFLCNREFDVGIVGTHAKIGYIGRDILNQWVILLDGKRELFYVADKVQDFGVCLDKTVNV